MIIRNARKNDIPKLISIVKSVNSIEDYPGEYNKKLFERMIKDKGIKLIVAEENNNIIGFHEFHLDKEARRIYSDSLAVGKKYRNKGIGRLLFIAMESYAKEKKAKRISLLVRDWNHSMNSIVKKKGYRISDKFYLWEKKI